MKGTLRAGSAIAIVGLFALAAVLLVSRMSGSEGSDGRAGTVILAALKASGFGTQRFPRTEDERTCTVHGGGPPPGVSYPGATCETKVIFKPGGSAIVFLTHVINGGSHTWIYRVTTTLRAHFLRDFGPGIAPEYWY